MTEVEAYASFASDLRERTRVLERELAERDREVATLRRRLARTSPMRIVALRKAG
jgi:predicted RNase H-like nuclease (RuvC/YqgF family)